MKIDRSVVMWSDAFIRGALRTVVHRRSPDRPKMFFGIAVGFLSTIRAHGIRMPLYQCRWFDMSNRHIVPPKDSLPPGKDPFRPAGIIHSNLHRVVESVEGF